MVDDYMIDKILDKIKMVTVVGKFDDANIFIETDDKFSDGITLKNVVMLIIYVIKDGDKFYSQIFLEEVLVAQKISSLGTF